VAGQKEWAGSQGAQGKVDAWLTRWPLAQRTIAAACDWWLNTAALPHFDFQLVVMPVRRLEHELQPSFVHAKLACLIEHLCHPNITQNLSCL
jgi:hypothetical protein